MVAAAVVGGAVVGGVASNIASSNAADTAADAQQQAADTGAQAQLEAARIADKTQRYMYDTTRQDYLDQIKRNEPFYQSGLTANNRLNYLLGLSGTGQFQNSAANAEVQRIMREEGINQADATARVAQGWNAQYEPDYGSLNRTFQLSDFQSDPVAQLGFQFGLDEGTKGINRSAAANGGLDSGATLKALTRYATDYTNTKAGESYNRYENNKANTYNRLASLAGVGQTANANNGSATSGLASAGQNAANNISQNALYSGNAAANAAAATGNARASSAIARGNGWSNAIGTGVNALSGYLQYGGGGSNPYGNYSATSYPVQDYYSGVNGTPI